MARRKKKRNFKSLRGILIIASVVVLAVGGMAAAQRSMPQWSLLSGLGEIKDALGDLYGYDVTAPSASQKMVSGEGEFEVHMLDVGQALSVFLRAPGGECALIDAGERGDGEFVCGYLESQGVRKLDYLIATHAHADHIGGMADVVRQFEIGKVIMSDLPEGLEPTTKVYTDLLGEIAKKGYKITLARPGTQYNLGEAIFELEAPNAQYQDLNNTSVVTRVTFGERGFLIEGDAELESERDMLRLGREVSADVLIAGHHGSSTSSSQKFLEAVSPQAVGISCGLGNKYGHPHEETLDKLQKLGCQVLRTDLCGTVRFYTDGQKLRIETER